MASPISPSTRTRLVTLVILLACALCIAFPRPWQGAVRGTAHRVAHPPQALLAGLHGSIREAWDRLAVLWRSTEELERLREENRALREALARLQAEAHEASVRLRDFTAFERFRQASLSRPARIVPANVVGVDTSAWRHSVVIDRGSADGLRLGTPAVWGNSIVGTVVALRPAAATVRLLNDSLAGLKVRVASTGDVGLLHGDAATDGLLRLKWLSLRPASAGDLVVTSGLDPAIPPGFVAGQVVQAPTQRNYLFYDVRVRPLIDLDRLAELLLVIQEPGDAESLLEPPPPLPEQP